MVSPPGRHKVRTCPLGPLRRRERRPPAGAIAAATVLATGIGALPVIALGASRARAAQGVLSGLAAGVMAIAATVGLLKPAGRQFWGAVLTSVPQVPGALVAWLAVEQIEGLLPASFALAGGAMLALVVVDLLPDAWKHASHLGVVGGTAVGAALMLAVGAAFGV